ncbi:MAG: phage portal protein [Candidatus Riflebacteria bacterium]|nr:phage portal protein [Candidatus Riflebacteria bacterium]
MGFISWIKSFFKNEMSDPMSIDELMDSLGIGSVSKSGISVTAKTALQQATVYSCVKLISETTAQLPLYLYRRTKTGRELAIEHPVYDLFHTPNDFQTAIEFWQFMAACAILRGRGYAYKNMVGSKVIELIPICNDSISENWLHDGTREFTLTLLDNRTLTVSPEYIFSVSGLTINGKDPVSPIGYMRETIGLAIASRDYEAKFFKNNARPSGILTTDQKLDKKVVEELKDQWNSQHGGDNSSNTAVLHGGLEYKSMSMTHEDAQFIESRDLQHTEICGIFGVPPHMIGIVSKSTSWGSGLTEQSLGFLKHTANPWLTRIEQSIARDLLTRKERKLFYAEHSTEKFLRADTKTRYEAHKIAIGGNQVPGFMTINEVREIENLEPIAGGDVIYTPLTGETEKSNETKQQI